MLRPFLTALLVCLCLQNQARAQVSLESARAALAQGREPEAQTILTQLVEQHSDEADVYLYLGSLLRGQGELAKATELFEQGTRIAPVRVDVRCELAMTYAWQKRFDDALTNYDTVLRAQPDNLTALRGKARVLAWAGEHDRASEVYTRLLARDPNDLEALRGLAFVQRTRLHNGAARSNYARVLALSPNDQEARAGLDAIQTSSRVQIDVAGGVASFAGAEPIRTFSGGLSVDATPEITPYVAYQSAALFAASGQAGTRDTQPWKHRVEAGVRLKPRPHWASSAGYVVSYREGALKHQVPLRLSREFGPGFVALAGLRPGMGGDTRRELLSDAGLQWVSTRQHWLMLQGFHYVNAPGDQGLTFLLSAFVRVHRWCSLRAGGGSGFENRQQKWVAFAEATVPVASRISLALSYEYLNMGFTRQAALISARVRI